MSKKIRVVCVDDSALVRRILSEMLADVSDIEVVGTAGDAYMARDRIKQLNPDVLTLDVEMPKMDGVTFLRNLMRLRPTPVIMVSSLTEHGAEITLDALALGAVDYLPKPKLDLAATLGDYKNDLVEKIRMASKAKVKPLEYDPTQQKSPAALEVAPTLSADAVLSKAPAPRQFRTTDRIIAIGASTGGTEAIKDVLIKLPADIPGIVITQHIPKAFSTPFAERLNNWCQITVCEAQHNQQVLPGHAYIAPGDQHLLLVRDGARYVCKLDDGPLVNRHKPAVDVLFRSVAQQAGKNAIGVILTGMGRDGAIGLKEMREAGSPTIAQDEASSVVWGMPGAAVEIDAAAEILPLKDVAARIESLSRAMDIVTEKRGTA